MKVDFFKNKWKFLSAIFIVLVLLFESRGEGDFKIFIEASRDLLSSKNIYQQVYNNWYHYYYDVLFAIFLIPLSFLPLYFAKLIWLILNVLFTYKIFKIVWGWLPINLLNAFNQRIFMLLSFLFVLAFLRDNFHTSQLTIFILYLTLQGLDFIKIGKKAIGSMLLALGITIKILPIVFVPYLIYRNEIKSSFVTIGFVALFLLLPAIIIGNDYNNYLLKERWNIINPVNKEHILDTGERSFHSLTTLLSTLLVKDCGDKLALPLKRNIADISLEKLNTIITLVRLVLILGVLFFIRSRPFKVASNNLQSLYEISYLCLLVPLIFPHQQHYAFLFILPASSYLIFYFVFCFYENITNDAKSKFRYIKITTFSFLLISYLLTNSHFILGAFNKYYDHFKTLTYGALILLVMLAFNNPSKIKSENI
jgi:hypothetical protein